MTSKDYIRALNLTPHPEGGFYSETYRSKEKVIVADGRQRNISTAIYFLLEEENRSHFHRLKSDELWFFQDGTAVEVVLLEEEKAVTITMGRDLEKGEVLHAVIPANTWFAARMKDGRGFVLVSCVVAPGFDFADFEMGKRGDFLKQFPNLSVLIEEFTRE